jgi:uncharacterized cupredoxin-like copper-binding protein
MIRLFVVVGIVGGLAIAYLATFAVGHISQLPPSESLLTGFRAEGVVPASVNLAEDESAEEAGVFEVPEEDEAQLKAAQAAAPAMNMGGSGSTEMANSDGGMEMGKGGLLITDEGDFDREITLTMDEWKFSEMQIDVKMGERIKFTVKNGGQIPHEFMFMSPALMNAVTYRATRADWSLYEHEALFEKALVLPGGEFTFVMQVQQAGAWMFMCMLPYHMQMGMMGQMATDGMAMDMSSM